MSYHQSQLDSMGPSEYEDFLFWSGQLRKRHDPDSETGDSMKNVIVHPGGYTEDLTDPGEDGYSLRELREIVGGYIEIVSATHGRIAVIDEEGKLKDKEFNALATQMAGEDNLRPGDHLVGTVLFCQPEHVK